LTTCSWGFLGLFVQTHRSSVLIQANGWIMRHIRTIIRLRLQTASQRNLQEKIADNITAFSGHILFVYVHIAWFGAWIVLNTGRLGVHPFDPFPYGLFDNDCVARSDFPVNICAYKPEPLERRK
jgi:hypothetical protein